MIYRSVKRSRKTDKFLHKRKRFSVEKEVFNSNPETVGKESGIW
jgi:hypothetical protein